MGAGCGKDHGLLIDTMAERNPTRLRVEVKGPPLVRSFPEEIDLSAASPPPDLTVAPYTIGVRLDDPGTYSVHIVDISTGNVTQSWSGSFEVDGVEKGTAMLRAFVVGDDDDGDGWPENCPAGALPEECTLLDCDDDDVDIHPFAIDSCTDEIDQDCRDGARDCQDADGDGVDESRDCDDNDPEVYPRSEPFCEGVDPYCGNDKDEDCIGGDTPCDSDVDCDGWARCEGGQVVDCDCNDDDPGISPSDVEICGDSIDQDCKDGVDNGCTRCDEDGDGELGEHLERNCFVTGVVDCNDSDRAVNHSSTADCGGNEGSPACAARGFCVNTAAFDDDDCDGVENEGCPLLGCDNDGDGFAGSQCSPPATVLDCNDANPAFHPGAPDVCGDGVMQNCSIDLPCSGDGDGDMYNSNVDCNDGNPNINPGALEACDAVDQDCDGVVDERNPGVTAGSTLQFATCTDDNDGVCAGGAGRCVCSPTASDGMQDAGGNRTICPGEVGGAVWGPRCFGAQQPASELCNAADDNCNGADDEGYGLGNLCDGAGDTDMCADGSVVCSGPTSTGCFDPGPSIVESCNFADDDCDTFIDEGLGLGSACDGSGDNDMCTDGMVVCNGVGGTMCQDGPPDFVDICNDNDDDCDGFSDEDFPTKGDTCDGGDSDLCHEGGLVCNAAGNGLDCTDSSGDNTELCNGNDDDCDGLSDMTEFSLGGSCDGSGDTDFCQDGTWVCNGAQTDRTCQDSTPNRVEVCNGGDDDCDTMFDEGTLCVTGQMCAGASGCVCNGTSCSGCCDGTAMCQTPSLSACGTGGGMCMACDTRYSDRCTGGVCRCGASPATACDPAKADNCTGGACRCGGAAACGGSQTCCDPGTASAMCKATC